MPLSKIPSTFSLLALGSHFLISSSILNSTHMEIQSSKIQENTCHLSAKKYLDKFRVFNHSANYIKLAETFSIPFKVTEIFRRYPPKLLSTAHA